jgi:PST family polysaccharide transporter
MATVFLGVVTIVSEFGLEITIVTLRDLNDRLLSQLNSVAIGLGFTGFLACCLAAYPLGWFFRSEALPGIVMLLGLTFPISAFRIVPQALLQKELRFKKVAVLEAMNVVVLSATMVVLARAGFRYWTLVIGAILSAIVTTAVTVASRPQSFQWPNRTELGAALTFTRYQLGGNLLWYWYSNADLVIAGRLLGAADLGVYSMAASTANAISSKIATLLTRVTAAYFATLQDQPAALKRYLLRLTELLSIVVFPALIGTALLADDLVLLVLGPKWLGAVGPVRVLAVAAAINSVSPLLSRVLTVRGQNRYLLWLAAGLSIVLPFGFAVGSRWGPIGIAAVWIILFPVLRIPVFLRVAASIGVSTREYLRAFWPAVSASIAMAVVVLACRSGLLPELPLLARLALEVAAGASIYSLVILTWHRPRVQILLDLVKAWRSGKAPGQGKTRPIELEQPSHEDRLL